jgi:DNA-binding SARP family transcriptional activator
MTVEFSVLGPVRVWRGPAELNIGPNQQRAILALLLVRANQLVPVDDMMELLWEQAPPASAVNVIHKYIGAIRRLLEPDLEARTCGRWLTRHGATYRLAADENMSDLMAFRRIVRDARRAHGEGRPANAFGLLLKALALWRGACGEGLDLYGRNRDYFTTVDQEYVAAVAGAADAALASAQAPHILPLLRQVAAGEPLNESLQARLILVLAATGQQAHALSHYQAVKERLSDELGVDPGAEMRTAHSKVLRQELPPAQPPGIGTTTLAIHWAHYVARHYPDGQLYLDLRGFDSGDSAATPLDALYPLGVPASHIPDGLDARLAALIPVGQAQQQNDLHHARADTLTCKLKQADAALTGIAAEIGQLAGQTDQVSNAIRERLTQQFSQRYDEKISIQAELQALEDAVPLPDNELPRLPGLLAQAPDNLRERLAAAFGMQASYRHDTGEATLVLTFTDTTPATIAAILADPRITTTPNQKPPLGRRSDPPGSAVTYR